MMAGGQFYYLNYYYYHQKKQIILIESCCLRCRLQALLRKNMLSAMYKEWTSHNGGRPCGDCYIMYRGTSLMLTP